MTEVSDHDVGRYSKEEGRNSSMEQNTSKENTRSRKETERSTSRFERARQKEQEERRERRSKFLERKLKMNRVSVSCDSSIFNANLDEEIEKEIKYEMECEQTEIRDQMPKKTSS